MKKLTNTQIKELLKNNSRSYTLDNGYVFEVYENVKSLADLDFVSRLTEQVMFIDGEYCPQYYEVVTSIAWLKVFTNILLVVKKIKETDDEGNNREFEIIDYETNYKIAKNIISYISSRTDKVIPCYFDSIAMIETIVEKYVNNKLNSQNNLINLKLDNLTSQCKESVGLINNVSNRLGELFSNGDMVNDLKELVNQVSDLKDKIQSPSDKKIVTLLSPDENITK